MTTDRVRRPIAVVVSRFPLVTETFVLRELIELERQGQPVVLVPLIRAAADVVHDEARPWVERAWYTPYLSAEIVRANLQALARHPFRYARLLARLICGSLGSPGMLLKTLALWPKCVYLAKRVAEFGIAHVHAHFATHPATAAFIASQLTGAGYSITVHAHDIFIDRTLLGPKARGAAFIRCISAFNRTFLLEHVSNLDAEKVLVIHTGVPTRSIAAAERPSNADAALILCVAALKTYKGIQVLLDACRILTDRDIAFRCDIIGDGPLRTELDAGIRRMGLEGLVVLRGARPQDAVAQAMREAALFVHPSIVASTGQMDGIPVALMEAMAAGCPVIASDLSGIPELIEDGRNGVLVPPGDATALADAMTRLLADRRTAGAFAAAGQETVGREFDLSENVRRLLTAIDRVNPSAGTVPEIAAIITALGEGDVGIRHVRRRADSHLTELLHSDGTHVRDFVLKRHAGAPRNGRGPVQRAWREFETLQQLDAVRERDRSTWQRFGAPEPVVFAPDQGSILMTKCGGQPLDALIRQARAGKSEAVSRATEALFRAGQWLRLFQASRTFFDGDGVTPCLDRAAADLRTCIDRRVLPARALKTRRRLEQLAASMSPESRQPVMRHGDFWPGNILVGERLSVVDFEAAAAGLRYQDVGYFLIHLRLYFQRPWRRAGFDRFAQSFLDGFAQDAAIDSAALELASVAAAVQALAHGDRTPSRLREFNRQRVFRSIVLRDAGVEPSPMYAWPLARGEAS